MRAVVTEVHPAHNFDGRTTYTVKILRHHPSLMNPESFPLEFEIRVEPYLVHTIPALTLLAEAAE